MSQQHRIHPVSLALSIVVTLAVLLGIDGLAASERATADQAQQLVEQQASAPSA